MPHSIQCVCEQGAPWCTCAHNFFTSHVGRRAYVIVNIAAAWSKEETLKLIEIWGNGAIQAQLEGSRRNQKVYDRITAELQYM